MDSEGLVSERKELWLALTKAQALSMGVMKNARNDYAGYDYVSADGMVGQLRQALLSNGLMFTRIGWSLGDGLVISRFMLVHAATGQHIEWTSSMPVIETKGRPSDKAVLGAVTTALSYTLRDLLLVARVDELEVDNRPNDDMMETPKPAPKASAADSSLVAAVKADASSRNGGDVWLQGCLAKASAIDGVKYRSVEELPERFLELMISNGGN